jgi:hypothetical protein
VVSDRWVWGSEVPLTLQKFRYSNNLAAGQADHDLVAVLDHVEVGDGLAHLAVQALGQLVDLVRGLLLGVPGSGGGVG